jgi:hypothetical protein
MKTLQWTDARSAEEALRQSQDEDVIVVRDGQPVAVVMALDEDDAYWLKREMDPAFIASIAQARKDVEEGRAISHEEMKRRLGID